MKNHLKMIGLLVVFLMVMTVTPMTVNPTESSLSKVTTYNSSETYTWQTFNRDMNVTTFVSSDCSKDTLWHFLNAAEESIYVEIYGINNPYILDLIHELHTTKPSLDMKFLIGDGSLGYFTPNDYVANNLTNLGLEVKWTNGDDFNYAHQKFVIIDNKTTIVHAGNWAKTSFPEDGKKANREWSIAMTDLEVTGYYRNVFDGDWLNGSYYHTDNGTGSALSYYQSGSSYPRPFSEAGEFSGPMNVTPIFSPDTSIQGILYMINSAQATLDIQIPYFSNTDEGGSVNQIVDAILAAKARGVTVRIITEEDYDFLELEELMIEHDIPVLWADSTWGVLHNKGIIVDGRMVLISSINYSDNSIENNREAGVIIENEEVAQWYQDIYDFDWGIGDSDAMEEVNVYWDPNIPNALSTINVTVYAHMLNGSENLDEVILGVKIGDGSWVNHSVIDNIFESSEEDLENYFYEIAPQTDGTNITVQAFIRVGTSWHKGLPMVIRVRDEIGSGETLDTTDPTIDSPADIIYEFDTIGHSITWIASDSAPDNYVISRSTTTVAEDSWNGSVITVSVDGLDLGDHIYKIIVYDESGNSATDSVLVTVTPTFMQNVLIILLAIGGGIAVLVVVIIKKKS
ncbi:MAG: phospholipase D-like domain-containing protein [Candidatus Thorarchaeota archaeon]